MAAGERPNLDEMLAPKQREILELVRLGLTDEQIAERTGLSTSGVKYHVTEIINKLGVRNRYEAASWPKRPPWWAAGFLPVGFLWRKVGDAVSASPNALTTALSGAMFAAALGGLAFMGFLLQNTNGGAEATTVATATPTECHPSDCEQASIDSGLSTNSTTGAGIMAVDCAAQVDGVQGSCGAPVGATFPVQIHVAEAPEDGYAAFQAKLRWDSSVVSYLPTADPSEEALWPECDVPARRDNSPGEPSVVFGCAPLPGLGEGDTFTGAVLQLHLRCEHEGTTLLELLSRAGDAQGGSHFLGADGRPIDPALAQGEVACGSPTGPIPVPTPEPYEPSETPQPTPPPSDDPAPPTPTPQPTGTPEPTATPETPVLTPTPTGTPFLPPGGDIHPLPEPERAACLITDFSVTTSSDPTKNQTDFILGQGVRMTLTVTNCGEEPVTFPSGSQYEFAVADATGRQIWDQDYDLGQAALEPGGTRTYWDFWVQRTEDFLPIVGGDYELSAASNACDFFVTNQTCVSTHRIGITVQVPAPDATFEDIVNGCPAWMPGSLVMSFQLDTTDERIQEIVSSVGGAVDHIGGVPGVTLWASASVPYGEERRAILDLREHPEVAYANVDVVICAI